MQSLKSNHPQLSSRAAEILERAIVCDLCLPWTAENVHARPGFLEDYAAAGGTFSSLTVSFGNFASLEGAVRHLSRDRRSILNNREKYVLVDSVDDIERAHAEGKMALSFNLQGCDPLAGDLAMVETFYLMGVRQMLLCYNAKNLAGDGCHERTDSGLSRYGVDLVKEMNRVGMIVDCTHTGYRTTMDMMEVSDDPVIFSHSNAKAVVDHDRNITDDQIKACARTGGLVGVVGLGPLLGNDASVDSFLRHVDHILDLVGPEHVGLGFDAVYTPEITYKRFGENASRYPGYPKPPWEFLLPQRVPDVVEGMVQRGYDDETIGKILGGNYLRVARQVWKPASRG
ncbi:MAG: membrane dipeptidase [Aquisalimonadaceae bacterium]